MADTEKMRPVVIKQVRAMDLVPTMSREDRIVIRLPGMLDWRWVEAVLDGETDAENFPFISDMERWPFTGCTRADVEKMGSHSYVWLVTWDEAMDREEVEFHLSCWNPYTLIDVQFYEPELEPSAVADPPTG